MTKSKAEQLAKLTPEQRSKKVSELRDELALLISKGGKTSDNFKAIKEIKKEIARTLTYESSIKRGGSDERE